MRCSSRSDSSAKRSVAVAGLDDLQEVVDAYAHTRVGGGEADGVRDGGVHDPALADRLAAGETSDGDDDHRPDQPCRDREPR
jgi:hypothetical protein